MKTRFRLILASALVLGLASASMAVRAQGAHVASSSAMSGQSAEPEANSSQKNHEAEEGTESFKKSPSVIAIGAKLGLSPEKASSAFEWLNFIIFAGVILYFLAKMLPKMFRGRTEAIQKGIVEARSATEEANIRLADVESRLSKLDGEIAALRAQSEKDAAADEARIKASVEEERQRIAQAAEQEIASAQAQAERSLREFAAQLAIEQAVTQMRITPEQDSELVRQFAGKLSKENAN